MLRICAWCKSPLGPQDQTLTADAETTHGICETCRVSLLSSHAPRPIHRYLNYFSLPVMLVDADARVITANQAALELVGKELDEVSSELTGQVMSCKHSFEPGGCGKTVHCVACAVRDSVIKTYETGEKQSQVPAYLEVVTDDQSQLLRFQISTEKAGDVVLLRIDAVNPPASATTD